VFQMRRNIVLLAVKIEKTQIHELLISFGVATFAHSQFVTGFILE
jgi:hypothetical protein